MNITLKYEDNTLVFGVLVNWGLWSYIKTCIFRAAILEEMSEPREKKKHRSKQKDMKMTVLIMSSKALQKDCYLTSYWQFWVTMVSMFA